jgi:hypothetical protein
MGVELQPPDKFCCAVAAVASSRSQESYLDAELHLEPSLSEAVSGRADLWSEADSYMQFSNYTVTPAD